MLADQLAYNANIADGDLAGAKARLVKPGKPLAVDVEQPIELAVAS